MVAEQNTATIIASKLPSAAFTALSFIVPLLLNKYLVTHLVGDTVALLE